VRAVNPSLLLLILVWVALLLPSALRSQLRASPRSTVGGFRRAMDVIATPPPGRSARVGRVGDVRPTMPRPEDPVVVRRRTRFLRLAGATGLSLAAAVMVGGVAWLVAGMLSATLVATTVVLRRLTVQRLAARQVVTRLDLRRPAQPLIDEVTGELVLAAGSAAPVIRLRSWR